MGAKRRRSPVGGGGGDRPKPVNREGSSEGAEPVDPRPTVTLAVDASVAERADSLEGLSVVAWRVARAAAECAAKEVVVFGGTCGADDNVKGRLARVLQCLETPPYLRKALIPRHPDLRKVGAVPRRLPHHPRVHDRREFREGVVVPDGSAGDAVGKSKRVGKSSLAEVGLLGVRVRLDRAVKLGVRVTVRLHPDTRPCDDGGEAPKRRESRRAVHGLVVPPTAPAAAGHFCGFNVRVAEDVAEVFAGGGRRVIGDGAGGGFDAAVVIVGGARSGGVSRRVNDDEAKQLRQVLAGAEHILVVFGGDAQDKPPAPVRGGKGEPEGGERREGAACFDACLRWGDAGSCGGLLSGIAGGPKGAENEWTTSVALSAVIGAASVHHRT